MSDTWTCRLCGEEHTQKDHLDLHLGRLHPEQMDLAEQAAYEAARGREEAWFRWFRRHVHASFAALPVVVFYVITVALVMEMSGNPAYPVMLFPGVVMFCALLYGMTYSRLAAEGKGAAGPPGSRGAR